MSIGIEKPFTLDSGNTGGSVVGAIGSPDWSMRHADLVVDASRAKVREYAPGMVANPSVDVAVEGLLETARDPLGASWQTAFRNVDTLLRVSRAEVAGALASAQVFAQDPETLIAIMDTQAALKKYGQQALDIANAPNVELVGRVYTQEPMAAVFGSKPVRERTGSAVSAAELPLAVITRNGDGGSDGGRRQRSGGGDQDEVVESSLEAPGAVADGEGLSVWTLLSRLMLHANKDDQAGDS